MIFSGLFLFKPSFLKRLFGNRQQNKYDAFVASHSCTFYLYSTFPIKTAKSLIIIKNNYDGIDIC